MCDGIAPVKMSLLRPWFIVWATRKC